MIVIFLAPEYCFPYTIVRIQSDANAINIAKYEVIQFISFNACSSLFFKSFLDVAATANSLLDNSAYGEKTYVTRVFNCHAAPKSACSVVPDHFMSAQFIRITVIWATPVANTSGLQKI